MADEPRVGWDVDPEEVRVWDRHRAEAECRGAEFYNEGWAVDERDGSTVISSKTSMGILHTTYWHESREIEHSWGVETMPTIHELIVAYLNDNCSVDGFDLSEAQARLEGIVEEAIGEWAETHGYEFDDGSCEWRKQDDFRSITKG